MVIYGVDGPFVPEENLFLNELPGSIHNLTHYLESVLVPGGPEVPITAIIDAVSGGRVAEVAAAFDQAVQAGLSDQLIAILQEVNELRLALRMQLHSSFSELQDT